MVESAAEKILGPMYGLWQGGFGRIAPEFLIAKVPSMLQKTSCGELAAPLPPRLPPAQPGPFPPQEMAFLRAAG